MLFLAECIRIFTTWQAIPFKRKFYCLLIFNMYCYSFVYLYYPFLACRSRQVSIVLERYFRFEISLLSILCMLIVRLEMGTSRVSGDSDIIT